MLVATVGHPVRCIVCGRQRQCRREETMQPIKSDDSGRREITAAPTWSAQTARSFRSDGALADICGRHDRDEITQALLLHGDDAFTTVEIV